MTGLISKVTVTLTNVNHTYPDDIDMLLVGPAGQSTLLMSHCGGGGQLNDVSLTFDDSALNYLLLPHCPARLLSGTFKPTQNQIGSVSFPSTNTAFPPPASPTGRILPGRSTGPMPMAIGRFTYSTMKPGDSGHLYRWLEPRHRHRHSGQ